MPLTISIINNDNEHVYFCSSCGKEIETGLTITMSPRIETTIVDLCAKCSGSLYTELTDVKDSVGVKVE